MDAGRSHLYGTEREESQIVGEARENILPERSQEDAAEEEEQVEQVAEGDFEDAQKKKHRERKEQMALGREDGKSLFPFSRVQKIIKADKVRSLYSMRTLNLNGCRLCNRIYQS